MKMNIVTSPDKKSISGWGFTSYSLKVLALLLMTLDHIYYYLGGGILPVPHFFTCSDGFPHHYLCLQWQKDFPIPMTEKLISNGCILPLFLCQ